MMARGTTQQLDAAMPSSPKKRANAGAAPPRKSKKVFTLPGARGKQDPEKVLRMIEQMERRSTLEDDEASWSDLEGILKNHPIRI
jgi:hypothetical protein